MKILNGRTGGARRGASSAGRRGAALLLSLLLLLILVAIVIQINVSTGTDARVARNDVTMTTMDLAIESALLQELETLKADGEADSGAAGAPGGASGAAGAGAAGAGALPGASGSSGAPGGGQASQPCDSRRDEWATAQRTELNQIRLRIIVQDENSKFNILNMLNPDEKLAEEAFERVVRILDACREGTNYDIDQRTAEEMAKAWLESLTKRRQSKLPRPKLLTDDEKDENKGMPLSLREIMPLQPFEDYHFKDFRDEDGRVVHSIGTFLTVWSSLQTAPRPASSTGQPGGNVAGGSSGATGGSSGSTGSNSKSGSSGSSSSSTAKSGSSGSSSGAANGGSNSGGGNTGSNAAGGSSGTNSGNNTANNAGSGAAGGGSSSGGSASTSFGYGVNVNTAPAAVLKSLFDSRVVSGRFWDKVVEYRNLEDEEEKKKQEEQNAESGATTTEEEQLDEYGQPVIKRRIFESLQELSEVDGYSELTNENQAKLQQMLTTQSEVFSIYVIARKATTGDASAEFSMTPAEQRKHEETSGDSLTRVVHAVYWRQNGGDGVTLTPILRWEVLDYVPYEVLDYPPDDR